MMIIGTGCRLRPYTHSDAPILAQTAGDFLVARWMTSSFPHPYTIEDARAWLLQTMNEVPLNNFVIEVGGLLAGGVGLRPHAGERLGVAEFGYWLGRSFWGLGIATEAAGLLVTHVFEHRQLRRLEAHVFKPNVASARVLEKIGFKREAVLHEAYVERDGTITDGLLYARLRSYD